MSKLGTLLSFAAALVLVCGVAGDARPTKQFTRPCELSGDAIGGGEVGVKAWSWGPLTMTVQGGGLEALFQYPGLPTDHSYAGPGRVGDSRLDLYFDPSSDDPCGPYEDNDGIPRCPYILILLNGVYYQNEDKVVFGTATEALIYDTYDPASPISTGTADLVVQFTDGDGGGDETGPEKTYEACHDGKDNDGDGLIDCPEDPNCKKVCS